VNTVYFPDNMSLKIAGNGTKFFSPVNRPTNQPCRLGVDTRELMQEYDTEVGESVSMPCHATPCHAATRLHAWSIVAEEEEGCVVWMLADREDERE
jgi:hypothetical protein